MIEKLIIGQDIEYIKKLYSDVLYKIHSQGPVDAADFEKLAYIKKFHPDVFNIRESELMYLMGLFYKIDAPKDLIEKAYSLFADEIFETTGNTFTPVQADAYQNIKEKTFFSFSAPTSAGKSFLFRELIVNATNDIIIVVPSRALVAEYINAVKELVNNTVLVLQFIDNVNILKTTRRVFIITPERGAELFEYKSIFDIGLFLFDEAQLSEEEVRGIRFDAFVRRVAKEFPKATKVFAHPYVQNPSAQIEKHHFPLECSAAVSYEQNSVGKIYVSINKNKMCYFSPFIDNGKNQVAVNEDIISGILSKKGSILVYSSKSKLYSKAYIEEYGKYLRLCPPLEDPNAKKYIEQLREYIGATDESGKKVSFMIRLMKRGIVIHHGSMPLKMRLIIEQFVRGNHARVCFATSTLKQGINMPFDAVLIDNFTNMDVLTLKNLIGRAGRNTTDKDKFDYGYTLVKSKNVKTFCQRINDVYKLNEVSELDNNHVVTEDNQDLIEAIRHDAFDNDTHLTSEQVERIKQSDVAEDVKTILDNLITEEGILSGKEYYENLSDGGRKAIKDAFKRIFVCHLRRTTLTKAEQSILSTAIPILLWHIQGKTFKEVLALRFSYLTQQSKQRKINLSFKSEEISDEERLQQISELAIKYSPAPTSLPDINAKNYSNFKKDTPVSALDYDSLVFDTYDYIDKVIHLSLTDPICAVFSTYFNQTSDIRAKDMVNYIRYGTNNNVEILLLRYGFSFEDIIWLVDYIEHIDEQQIVFKDTIHELTDEQYEIISRFV